MFLITTADQRFWEKDTKVLFLGEWCKLYSKKADWGKMDHEVLGYHWDDHQKLFKDYQYLKELYERVLADMTDCLNTIHGESHSIRYWRMIIGPWLFIFIQIFYDRWASIEKAGKTGRVTNTIIGNYPNGAWVPKDYDNFIQRVLGDEYNHFLYSWIIQKAKPFPFQCQDVNDETLEISADKKRPWLKRFIKGLIFTYEKYLPYRFNKYVLVSSYLGNLDLWKLQLSLGQWPTVFAPPVKPVVEKVKMDLRSRIHLSNKKGPFEELLSGIIGSQIPTVYLEGYQEMKKQAVRSYPFKPKFILTANDFYENESFKSWSAGQVERGVRFAAVQHGGLFGTALFCSVEEHEIKISDVFYTWGWESKEDKNTRYLSASKLNQFKNKVIPSAQGKVLLTLGLVPRYSFHLNSTMVASVEMLDYLKNQFSFINALDERARQCLMVRVFPQDYGWSQKERFQDNFPEIGFDTNERPIIESMSMSRLYVATYNATTYLESFAANFPTVIFWDPRRWEIRPSAREYFDGLQAAGIFHDSPQSAAKKVNEIFDDPMSWWLREDVQKAKNKFCHQFARTSENWLQEWRAAVCR